MESNAYAVLETINAAGGTYEYTELLSDVDGDEEDVHLTVTMLQRDGYVYQPTTETVGIV